MHKQIINDFLQIVHSEIKAINSSENQEESGGSTRYFLLIAVTSSSYLLFVRKRYNIDISVNFSSLLLIISFIIFVYKITILDVNKETEPTNFTDSVTTSIIRGWSHILRNGESPERSEGVETEGIFNRMNFDKTKRRF